MWCTLGCVCVGVGGRYCVVLHCGVLVCTNVLDGNILFHYVSTYVSLKTKFIFFSNQTDTNPSTTQPLSVCLFFYPLFQRKHINIAYYNSNFLFSFHNRELEDWGYIYQQYLLFLKSSQTSKSKFLGGINITVTPKTSERAPVRHRTWQVNIKIKIVYKFNTRNISSLDEKGVLKIPYKSSFWQTPSLWKRLSLGIDKNLDRWQPQRSPEVLGHPPR